jgi:hypothetical protein
MSTLRSTHDHIHDLLAGDGELATDAVSAAFDDGFYLTDESFLFRVIGVVDTDAGEMVELEDCWGLDIVRVPITAPRLLGLRVVLPEPSRG